MQHNISANNFKTFQQTRKAVTANSTQASNSPRKTINSSKLSDHNNGTNNTTRVKQHPQNVQDPVFMNTN